MYTQGKRILYLILHKRWFNEIVSGRKKIEYRDVTPYWQVRIEGRSYNEIHFKNGYNRSAPFMRVEYKGWKFSQWKGKRVYALVLGEILEIRNYSYLNVSGNSTRNAAGNDK